VNSGRNIDGMLAKHIGDPVVRIALNQTRFRGCI
jgi:hypothetical protein